MPNPLDYVTTQDLIDLGLSLEEISDSYNPSKGGVFHARGAESMGKTLWVAHFYRYLVDKCGYSPSDAVGNMTFKGKYNDGYKTLKGDDLKQYLWDLTHQPYRGKIVIIDEIDSEFPARFFSDVEQTEIALRLWHIHKLGNFVLMTSHLGNSTDLIIHLASHYIIIPRKPEFETNTMDFTLINKLDIEVNDYEATDVIKTMLIYNRRELTENTTEEADKIRPSLRKKQRKKAKENSETDFDLDLEAESQGFTF